MKFQVFSAAIMVMALASTIAQARENGGRGGGDPLANQFLDIARAIELVQAQAPIEGVDIYSVQIKNKISEIQSSLQGLKPQVVFPNGDTLSCFGEPKLGCVQEDGQIQFARDGWIKADMGTKVQVAAMELILSLGAQDRYGKAELVAKTIASHLTLDSSGSIQITVPFIATVKACNDPTVNLGDAPVGFQCRTTKEAIFERVDRNGFGKAWKSPDGVIWSQILVLSHFRIPSNGVTQMNADNSCRALGALLPSVADYQQGDSLGVKELIGLGISAGQNVDGRLWTSNVFRSVNAGQELGAYLFDALYGGFDTLTTNSPAGYLCISSNSIKTN